MKMCTDCGKYEALTWSSKGLCLRCWFKPSYDNDPPPADEQLEITGVTGPKAVYGPPEGVRVSDEEYAAIRAESKRYLDSLLRGQSDDTDG